MNKAKTLFYSILALSFTLISCDPDTTKNQAELPLPTLTTIEPTAMENATATSGGIITSDGGSSITARGVCWAVAANPTIADGHSVNGGGIGAFSSPITGLAAETTYYVRAYATNSNGTAYGSAYQIITKLFVSDIDGNIYHTTKSRNGDIIGTTFPATKDITSETTPKYQWSYNGDEVNVAKYGRLYTWYAVVDTRNIAPTGWHVATDAEWTTLETYVSTHVGTSVFVAKALASTTGWDTSSNSGDIGNNLFINNYSGFSGLPGGYRDFYDGAFSIVGSGGYWWSSTAYDTSNAWRRHLYYNTSNVGRLNSTKSRGFSVRCVRDSN